MVAMALMDDRTLGLRGIFVFFGTYSVILWVAGFLCF